MSFFKKITSVFKAKKAEKLMTISPVVVSPLCLDIHALISPSDSIEILLKGSTEVRMPEPDELVCAKGVIELGQGDRLHRFYMDNEDVWIQVQTSGYDEHHVENIVLFNYVDCRHIHTEQELDRLAGKESLIGLPTYSYENKEYAREWGSEEGQTELVQLIEKVTTKKENYEVKHLSMLYSADIDLSNRREFLLFSVEETEAGDSVLLSTSLGVTIFSTDFQTI